MVIEIALVVIAIVHVLIISGLIVVFFKLRKPAKTFFSDTQKISLETVKLLDSLNELVQSDLHNVSTEATSLVSNVSNLVSDLNDKSKSMNFLFKPLSFLNSDSNFSKDEPEERKKTFPEMIKWGVRGLFLYKSTKEFLRRYGK